MKTLLKIIKVSCLALVLISCSTDDNGSNSNDITGNYFPLTLNNYWNFEVTNRNLGTNVTQTSRDSLYVATANANDFGLVVNGIATGTMNTILTQSTVSRTASALNVSGTITFPFDGLDDLRIPMNNAVFYDLNAPSNALLSSVEGSMEQTVESLPIVTNYAWRTVQGDFAENLVLNNDAYTNVTQSLLILELSMTTEIEVIPGSFVEVLIMAPQEVLSITSYYAENFGLVRSEAAISFQLEDFSQIGITLPFTSNLDATSIQAMDGYGVADE